MPSLCEEAMRGHAQAKEFPNASKNSQAKTRTVTKRTCLAEKVEEVSLRKARRGIRSILTHDEEISSDSSRSQIIKQEAGENPLHVSKKARTQTASNSQATKMAETSIASHHETKKKVERTASKRSSRTCTVKSGEMVSDSEKEKTKNEPEASESFGSNESSDEDIPHHSSVVSSRMAQRTEKQKLIAKVLCRWWYALDPWPPENFDYEGELHRRRYKVVPLSRWEEEDDVDKNGFTKVYPIPFYCGIYRDPKGNAVDIRPLEGKPCYLSLKELSELELTQLLYKAVKNQLSSFQCSPYIKTEQEVCDRLMSGLKAEMNEALERLKVLSSTKT